MEWVDFVVIAVVVLIVGLAGLYVYRSKKNGKKCIGCPDSVACSGKCSGCSCGCSNADK